MSGAYEKVKDRLTEIRELIEDFPEACQPVICQGLVKAVIEESRSASGFAPELAAQQADGRSVPEATAGSGSEIPGVALIDEEGRLRITLRDLGGKTKTEKARRLVYIAIRAYGKLTGEEGVSSRQIVTPILKEWRLYDGNSRAMMASDKGIQRNGDVLRLDVPGKREADEFIAEAQGQ